MPRTALTGVKVLAALAALTAASAHTASAGLNLPTGFQDVIAADSLHLPVSFAFVPDPPSSRLRVLVVEQKWRRIVQVTTTSPTTPVVGTVPNIDWVPGECGLLSIAVDPRWPAKPFVYVHYTAWDSVIQLARFTLAGDLANTGDGLLTMDPATRMLVLADVPDTAETHNGGALRFGPDSMLYLSLGEDTRECWAQDTTKLPGKLLRLDVRGLPDTGPGPPPKSLITPADNPHASSPDSNFRLIHSYGLRNPFRFHIDPLNGGIFIADVGHLTWEEIDWITGPANLGWPWREGLSPWSTCPGPMPTNLTDPIVAVPHAQSKSIMSLGVYRAPPGAANAFPADYEGDYFYADYFNGWVRRIGFDGSSWVSKPAPGQPNSTDWATGGTWLCEGMAGPDGAWWYLIQSPDSTYLDGELHRVVWVGTVGGLAPGPAPRVRFDRPRPNPARGDVRLDFALPAGARAELSVMDVGGRRVRELARGDRLTGTGSWVWDGRDDSGQPVPPGLYFARLRTGSEVLVRRMVLAR